MTRQPHPEPLTLLEMTRDEFVAAASGLTDTQAGTQPGPDRWSVIECVEHIVVTESGVLSWLQNAQTEGVPAETKEVPRENKEKEAQIAARLNNREAKIQAPETIKPVGRYKTLAEALDAFQSTRARTIEFAGAKGSGVYSLVSAHPAFGALNGGELLVLIASHSSRHGAQIREVRAQLGCE